MTIQINRFFLKYFPWRLIQVFLFFLLLYPGILLAAFGDDLEKPEPEFFRKGDTITAKLIPRAKNSSVQIKFKAVDGNLAGVEGMDFDKADGPDVDKKDFKSALFVIKIDHLSSGSQAKIAILSDFFTTSTQYWIFNPKLKQSWVDAKADNLARQARVHELLITVKDGGPFDNDGLSDGQITIIGGPKDSFWGYALGTLFIRYFGIFMVLSILMIGMILSGMVFQALDKKRQKKTVGQITPHLELVKKEAFTEEPAYKISPETAAAIGAALHLYLHDLQIGAAIGSAIHISLQKSQTVIPKKPSPVSGLTPWTLYGRKQNMNERFLVYNRNMNQNKLKGF